MHSLVDYLMKTDASIRDQCCLICLFLSFFSSSDNLLHVHPGPKHIENVHYTRRINIDGVSNTQCEYEYECVRNEYEYECVRSEHIADI